MGHAMVACGKPDMAAPVSGILASDLAVGSVVKLMEGGVATEYLVVNQGKPSGSSLYDDSCDGLWLLRKDIHGNRAWDSSMKSDYQNSPIHSYLNVDFFNIFGVVEQSVIKQVKIPYVNGTGGSAIASGTNGLTTKIFLLGGYEMGYTTSDRPYYPVDGAKLDYFPFGIETEENNQRIGYLNGTATDWWLRSASTDGGVCYVHSTGICSAGTSSFVYGIRPAVILPSNALFDTNTLILKGVV